MVWPELNYRNKGVFSDDTPLSEKKNEIKTTRFSSKHNYDQNSTIATKEWF
jgi:hypothetical protein